MQTLSGEGLVRAESGKVGSRLGLRLGQATTVGALSVTVMEGQTGEPAFHWKMPRLSLIETFELESVTSSLELLTHSKFKTIFWATTPKSQRGKPSRKLIQSNHKGRMFN